MKDPQILDENPLNLCGLANEEDCKTCSNLGRDCAGWSDGTLVYVEGVLVDVEEEGR